VILSEGSPSGAGWQPRLLLAGYWRAIPMRKIRHAVDSCARPMKAERFRSAFDLSRIGEKIPRLIGMDCDVLRVSLHHEMDPKSRAIYEHNGPVTNDRLQDMRNIDRSDAELFCIDFLESRQEVEA